MNYEKKYIGVACPEYRGAPMPEFDPMSINESRFEDDLRYKYCDIYIDRQVGYVNWLAEANSKPSDAWEAEIKRAFKENGLENGSIIHVKFDSRSIGCAYVYDMTA